MVHCLPGILVTGSSLRMCCSALPPWTWPCWVTKTHLAVSVGVCWCLLVSVGVCWCLLVSAGVLCCILFRIMMFISFFNQSISFAKALLSSASMGLAIIPSIFEVNCSLSDDKSKEPSRRLVKSERNSLNPFAYRFSMVNFSIWVSDTHSKWKGLNL